MFSVLKTLKSAVLAFLLFAAGLVAAGFWAAYFFPPVIAWAEARLGRALPYEVNIRFYLAGMVLILLIFYLIAALYKTSRAHLLVSFFLLAGYGILPLIFVFDTRHSLIEEMSWIRYPSALALLLAGVVFFLVARHFNQGEKWPAKKETVWLALSAGFIFAGVDEIAEIHEKIGYVLEKLFRLAHFTTDIVTMVYFVAGILILVWFLPTIIKTMGEKSKFFGQLGFFAVLLFGLAQFFDTFDNFLLGWLRRLAGYLVARGYFFSDAWYIIYEPKKFLNGLEEIFEYLSGILFFAAGVILLFSLNKSTDFIAARLPSRFKKIAGLGGLTLSIFVFGSLFFVKLPFSASSPLEVGGGAAAASVRDGLFHSDDLSHNPNWGVVLANESEIKRRGAPSGPAVFVFKNNQLKKLADPRKLLADTDSVASDDSAIYASDGAQGKIFRYQNETEGFVELASRKNGLKTPEGLVVFKKELFIIDETEKSVSRLGADGKVSLDFPRHPLWQSPEGIAYHPSLGAFLITDDKTGTIFKYNFGQPPEVWASRESLASPEDIFVDAGGDIWVTDGGRGEAVVFEQNGALKKRLRFRPLFRDLQGVASDSEFLYVISADAYGSASFIPSYLWKIPLQQ